MTMEIKSYDEHGLHIESFMSVKSIEYVSSEDGQYIEIKIDDGQCSRLLISEIGEIDSIKITDE